VPVTDAIRRGLVTARLLADDDPLLTFGVVDRRDALVVDRIARLRTKLRVVNAFKAAAAAHHHHDHDDDE